MSVLIKGMKMPDSCRHCCMMTGTFCDILNIDVDPYYDGAKHRNVCCPLVELPEKHGRLIDVDALVPDICHDWNGWCPPDDYSAECILKAPTVIEADGEE